MNQGLGAKWRVGDLKGPTLKDECSRMKELDTPSRGMGGIDARGLTSSRIGDEPMHALNA